MRATKKRPLRPSHTQRSTTDLAYAASVIPGLEEVASQEIKAQARGAQIVESRRGWVIFRYPGSAQSLLSLRTTEDVFVVLFHTDTLPAFRKGALSLLTRMARSSRYWDQAMTYVQQTRRKSIRRVTFRVIAQMTGKHGFRRQEARDAVLAGIQMRWANWKPVADDAHLEIWAPVIGEWAMIAIRLSDRKMRHRTYKEEHRPASLRPSLAAAMVALTKPKPGDRFCDPMCGAGTLLAERALTAPYRTLLGGDIDPQAVRAAAVNLAQVTRPKTSSYPDNTAYSLHVWDASALSLHSGTLDAVVCNLPFGEQVGSHADNPELYDRTFAQLARVLRLGGRAVLLTSEKELMRRLLHTHTEFYCERQILIGILGRAARIYVLQKRS